MSSLTQTVATTKRIPSLLWTLGSFVVLFVLGFVLSEFQTVLVSQMLIVGLFALSLNLIMGYGGMVTFGHAAFYGIGAYTVAMMITNLGLSPWLGILAAPFVSALFALPIGWFSVRRVRLYFSILTLAFGQLLFFVVFQSYDITGGDNGIHGFARPEVLDSPTGYYLFTVLVFAACFLVLRTMTNAPFTLTLRAIRENPERAQFLGVEVRRHQLITFIIGAFFAGIAGALMAELNRFVGPEMLFWTTSSEPILASLMGGMFSLAGPAVGAALLVFLNITITRYTEYWPTVLGALTIIIVLFAPTGLVGLVREKWFGNK